MSNQSHQQQQQSTNQHQQQQSVSKVVPPSSVGSIRGKGDTHLNKIQKDTNTELHILTFKEQKDLTLETGFEVNWNSGRVIRVSATSNSEDSNINLACQMIEGWVTNWQSHLHPKDSSYRKRTISKKASKEATNEE